MVDLVWEEHPVPSEGVALSVIVSELLASQPKNVFQACKCFKKGSSKTVFVAFFIAILLVVFSLALSFRNPKSACPRVLCFIVSHSAELNTRGDIFYEVTCIVLYCYPGTCFPSNGYVTALHNLCPQVSV